MWKCLIKTLFILTAVSTCGIIFQVPVPFNIDLTDYQNCLTRFYKSQPVWSWVIMHDTDQKQPFDDMLNAIYKTGVPLYNYNKNKTNQWFQKLTHISSMPRESKIFILSRNTVQIDLMTTGSNSFRRGDKILFSNYDIKIRVSFDKTIKIFLMVDSVEGLTRYNVIPIISFLLVSTSGQVDPFSYVSTDRSDLQKADKVHLTCEKLFSNSIDKLIFNSDYFTIAAFETVHALQDRNDYFGRDAIILKILVGYTKFKHVYSTPTDGATYGNEHNYSGVYKEVVNDMAQMALNSRFFLTKIITDNVVEYTYPFNRDDLVILIPVKLTTSQLAYFTYYSYGASLGTIISLYFYFKLAKQGTTIVEVVMVFIQICSGKPLKEFDIRFFRIIYMSLMVVSFYGYTLFNIQILSALTLQPSELGIKSVQEFAKTEYKIFSSTTIKSILSESLENDKLAPRILPRIQTPSSENETMQAEEKLLKNCSEYAVICSKSTAMYYMDLSNVQSKEFCYNIVPEAIMPSLVTYILGHKSPFQDKFNELLSRIIESGLVANYTSNPVRKKVAISDEVKPFGMHTYREKIAWYFYVIGVSVAFGVFILELFIGPYLLGCF